MEKAREEAIVAFKRSIKYKNRLDNRYAADYKDFYADAKEAFPNMDFNSFKIPLAIERSLLPMSFEDANVVDDATNEVTQDGENDPNSGGLPPVVYLSEFTLFLEKFYYFSLLEIPVVLGFALFRIHSSTILSSKFMDKLYIQ